VRVRGKERDRRAAMADAVLNSNVMHKRLAANGSA
jgi:hypothetical protein